MAISPRSLDTLDIVAEVAKFEVAFDTKLQQLAGMEGGIYSSTWDSDRPGYRQLMVVIPGTMTPAVKNELSRRYEDAGWSVKSVANSYDNGEMPGLASITFYIAEQE